MAIFGQLVLWWGGAFALAYGVWAFGQIRLKNARIANLEREKRELEFAISQDAIRHHGPGTAP